MSRRKTLWIWRRPTLQETVSSFARVQDSTGASSMLMRGASYQRQRDHQGCDGCRQSGEVEPYHRGVQPSRNGDPRLTGTR